MRKAFLLLCIIACNANQPAQPPVTDTVKVADNSPGITIDSASGLTFTTTELQAILDLYPVLNKDYPPAPDEAYAGRSHTPPNERLDFSSEAGQDQFYQLYNYFLSKKNAHQHKRRARLIQLYNGVNDIYGDVRHGGTYFGHQHQRIPAYVEYDLTRLRNADSTLPYTNLKPLYINLFKEDLKSEIAADPEINIAEGKKLLKKVDELAPLITDYADLVFVRRFQYANY